MGPHQGRENCLIEKILDICVDRYMFTNHIRHNKLLIFSLVVAAEMEDWQARKQAEYSVYEEKNYLGFLCTLYVV